MKKLLSKLFSAPRARTPKSRLNIETLEGRLVPASLLVTTTADLVNPNDGVFSLREAISLANTTTAADSIQLNAGVYAIQLTGQGDNANLRGDFDITNPLTITGTGSGTTVIDAAGRDRVFDVIGTFNATFNAVTLRNGFVDGNGGGIQAGSANLTLNQASLRSNQALNGGGINVGVGSLSLVGCKVADNSSFGDYGGGLYAGNGNVTVTNSIVTGNSSQNAGGIFAQQGVISLTGTLVSRNRAADNGGGLYAANGSLNLTNCIVRTNVAGRPESEDGDFGGGAFARIATVTNSTFSNNTAYTSGGGMYVSQSATVTGSTFSGNTARSEGGGLYVFNTARLTNSTVSNNTAFSATGYGGGLVTTTAVLAGCTVSGNSAGNGGGVASTAAFLSNSTVSGNHAAALGGGVFSHTGASLTNCTVSGNSALTRGGAIHAANGMLLNSTISENFAGDAGGVYASGAGGAMRIKNTIIANNLNLVTPTVGRDVLGFFASEGYNLIGVFNGGNGFGAVGDQLGTVSAPLDPLLGDLAFNGGPTQTHALLAGSSAIDRGNATGAPATDQRGVARPRDGDNNGVRVVDIGAFEK